MKTLLLDIETAPHRVYAWGLFDQTIGLNQIEEPGYTMSWAAKWYGNKEVMFDSLFKSPKKDMLIGIHNLIDEADAVVHYNGTKFDIPTLNQEFIVNDLSRPAPYKQIDLLRTAKRQFRLPSNKLSYVLHHLGLEGKLVHKGMSLWRDCMAGDADAWKTMEEYNKTDVIRLEQVYERLLPWIDNHPNRNLYVDDGVSVCPKCGSKHLHKRGFSYTNTMRYQRLVCLSCGTWSRERVNNLPKEKKAVILTEAK